MARTAYNTDAKESYQSIDLPLYLPFTGISSGTDPSNPFLPQYIRNGIIVEYKNQVTGKLEFQITPRLGFNVSGTYSSNTTSDTASRGIFYWDKTAKVYSVFADILDHADYGSGTNTNLTTSYTGGVTTNFAHFTEYFDGSTYYLITKKTNPTSKAYRISVSNVLTEITVGDYPNTTAVGQFVSLDGYLFVLTNEGKIYNSDLGSATAWTSTNFITCTMSADRGVGLSKYKNQIVSFGVNSIEFFYNAANPTGSPLSRTEQAAIIGIGCIDAKTIIEMQDTIYWISGADGNYGVYCLENFKPKKVSTSYIDSLISHNQFFAGDYYAGKIVISGVEHYYFANLSRKDDLTLLYNPKLDIWLLWSSNEALGPCPFGGYSSSVLLPSTYGAVQALSLFPIIGSNTTRKIIEFSDTGSGTTDLYIASSTNAAVNFEIKTRPLDFGTHNWIRIHKIVLKMSPYHSYLATEYTLNNLGRFRNPTITFAQTTYNGDMTVSVNGGTAKTIATLSARPSMMSCSIYYSVCEH